MEDHEPHTDAGVAIANGCFFNLGARLARYTQNETYANWATETFDWLWRVQYIDHENWRVYDGGHVGQNCTDINKAQFSYNSAILLQGSAFMYNYVSTSMPIIWYLVAAWEKVTHPSSRTRQTDHRYGRSV
jgi:mannan endo-1,6-alpha-mannosidase